MDLTVGKSRIEWTSEILADLVSQLMSVCKQCPDTELTNDVKSQLVNISNVNAINHLPKDMFLDHLVSILQDLTSKEMINSGIANNQILDDLMGIIMVLLSFSDNTSEIHEILSNIISDIMKISRVEPVNEINQNLDLVTEVIRDLMPQLAKSCRLEYLMLLHQIDKGKSEVSNISMIPREEILNNLICILREKLSKVIGNNSEREKSNDDVLYLFVRILQQLTTLVKNEGIIPGGSTRDLLIGMIKALLSLVENESEEMSIRIGKLKEMLFQLVNIPSLNPVIEIPEKISLIIERDSIEESFSEIKEYLKLLTESRTGPIVWVPRKLLLLCLKLPQILPCNLQKKMQLHLEKILNHGMSNDIALDPVCVLSVDMMPLLSISNVQFVSDMRKSLEFLTLVFSELHSEILNIYRTQWRNEIVYSNKNRDQTFPESVLLKNMQSEILNISMVPKDNILDYIFNIFCDKFSLVMGSKHAWMIHKDRIMETLITLLKKMKSLVMGDGLNGKLNSEIRDLLIGMTKTLLLLLVNIPEMALIYGNLEDMMSQLLNISRLNPAIEKPNKLWFLEMDPETVPINLVVYHLSDISEYLQSLTGEKMGTVVWLPRNLLAFCTSISHLLPWHKQNKLLLHLKRMVGILPNDQKLDLVCVLPAEMLPLQIHVAQLITMHKNEILDSSCNITKIMISQRANITNMKWTSTKLKEFMLKLTAICLMLPENELLKDIQSQLINILDFINQPSPIPEVLMLDHLVAIVQDMIPLALKFNSDSELEKNEILDGLFRLVLALESLSRNTPGMVHINELLEGMLSSFLKTCRVHCVIEIWQSLAFAFDVYKKIHSELVYITRTEWRDEIFVSKTYRNKMVPESKLDENLHITESIDLDKSRIQDVIMDYISSITQHKYSQVNLLSELSKNQVIDTLIEVQSDLMTQALGDCVTVKHKNQIWDHSIKTIWDRLSQVMKSDLVFGIPKDILMDHFIRILQKLTSQVLNGSVLVSGIPKSEIRDLLLGIIKALRSWLVNIPEMTLMSKQLDDMLSQLLNKSGLNPVIVLPEKLQLLMEMDTQGLPIKPNVEHLSDMTAYLESLFENQTGPVLWVHRKLLEHCKNLHRMLPCYVEKKLLSHVHKTLDFVCGISNESAHISLLPVELMPLIAVMRYLTSLPQNQFLDLVNVKFMDSDNKSQLVDRAKIEWTNKNIKDLLTPLMAVCETLRENDMIQDLLSQLVNISKIDPVCGTMRDVILCHLVGILQDVRSEVVRNKILNGEAMSQNFEQLQGVTKALLSLSKTPAINGILEDMLFCFMKMSKVSTLNQGEDYLSIVLKVFEEIMPELQERATMEWESEMHQVLVDIYGTKSESKLEKAKQIDVVNLHMMPKEDIKEYFIGVIHDKLSQVMGADYVRQIGLHKDQMLDYLVSILQQLTLLVTDESAHGHVSKIPQNEIRDISIAMIKALVALLVNKPELVLMKKRLNEMLSELLNKSSLNPDIEISESLLVEIDHETVPINFNVKNLNGIKIYLESVANSRTGPVVWVPRKLLLFCLNIPTLLSCNLEQKLLSHLKNMLHPISGITNDNCQDPVGVLHVELMPLLKVMNIITTLPKDEVLDVLSHKSIDITKENLSKFVNKSRRECTSNKLNELLSQLVEFCKNFHGHSLIQKVESNLEKLLRIVSATETYKEGIQDPLVEILLDLTSQVMCIDPAKGTHKKNNRVDDRMVSSIQKASISAALKKGHVSTGVVPTDIALDHHVAILRDKDETCISPYMKLSNIKVMTKKQVLDDFMGIIRSLQSLSELNSVRDKLNDILSSLNESRMEDNITRDLIDPEREEFRDYGLQLIAVCKMLPESALLEGLLSQIKYLVILDHEYKIPKEVILDRLIAIHQDLSGIANMSKIGAVTNRRLTYMLSGLISRMEAVTDLMSRLLGIFTLQPENEFSKHLKSQIMHIINTCKMNPANVPKDQIIGMFVLIIKSLPLNMHGITKEKMEENLRVIGKDMTSLLQYISLVGGIHSTAHSQVTNEFTVEWTSEAIKYLVTWFKDIYCNLPERELVENIKLQLLNISRINTATKIDVIVDGLFGILQEIVHHVLENKDLRGIPRNLILDDLTGAIMGLMSLCGNISQMAPTNESLKDMLFHVNESRMDARNKALKNEILSKLKDLSPKPKNLNQTKNFTSKLQDQMLDHIFLMCNYLLSLSLYVSDPSDVRMKLKQQLSRAMNISRIDPESGLPKDVLSLLVYIFFLSSHSYYHISTGSHQRIPQYILKTDEEEVIYTGSVPECLNLSCTYKQGFGFPDFDQMVHNGWFQDCYDTMSLEMDKAQPVFCMIKHGMASGCIPKRTESMLDGLYLNSAKINYVFRMSKLNHRQYRKYDKDKTKNYYDSASLVFASDESTISQDVLICIPIVWPDSFRQKFIRRLQANKWPLKFVPNLDKLLTERVYAIPKPDPQTEQGCLRWRLSFSVIETELARSLTDLQRRCYRVLKAMIKNLVNAGLSENKQFSSYYLKTAMFWFCEYTSEESWKIQTLGIKWLELLDSVIESLGRKELLMYFVPAYNLLNDTDAGCISVWKEQLMEIRKEPLRAFEMIYSEYEFADWQSDFLRCILTLGEAYSKLTLAADNQQHTDIGAIYKCYRIVAEFLLATYRLEDFQDWVKHFPHTNKLIHYAKADSKDHLIWMYYNEFSGAGYALYPNVKPDYSKYWSYLAEVTHHIFLKYGDQVPDKDLFCTQTVERFHLIACSIQNEEKKVYNYSEKHIKYANYLRADEQYEEATLELMKFCQRIPPEYTRHRCTLSRVTSEVLDTCLKLTVALQAEFIRDVYIFAYHLLTVGYMHAGVLAEVCFPQNMALEWIYVVLGFQLITCGQLQKAFQAIDRKFWFYSMELLHVESTTRKYAAMLFIIARSISKTNQR